MIRLNVSKEMLETGVGLESVVQKIFWYQIFWKDAIGKDIRKMKLLKDMYEAKNGDTILINKKTKLVDGYYNLVKPLCDTATNTFIGRVPDIVTRNNEKEKARISNFTLKMKHSEFEEEITDVSLQSSICGSGFLGVYAEIGDKFPRFRSLDPLFTNVVYDCSIAMKRLFAYYIYFDAQANGGSYVCIIYTKDKMYAYYTPQISIPTKMAFSVYPYQLFMINGAELTYVAEHGFNDIPIYEFMNNKLCMGDCTPALSVITLYSMLQNNRFQNVDDIINYLLVIKNARLGDDDETSRAIELVKNQRVLPIEGDDVDAKFLSNPLNQTDIQTLANEYKNLIHYITHIPDLTSVDFSQNASDPIIKIKTKPLLDLCVEKEKWFNRSYIPMLDMVLAFVRANDSKLFDKIRFDIEEIDLVYTHTLPSNDSDMVRNIVNLANVGMANPRVLLQSLSFIPNVDDYIADMEKYNEYVDKRKMLNNNKNNGLNETNLERQNKEPLDKSQEDNVNNDTLGKSNNLSENTAE